MPNSDGRNLHPSLRPTRPSTLVVAGLATAAAAWLLIGRFYADFPAVPWLPALVLLALAALEFYAAANTKARIDRRGDIEPVDPLLVAKFVVLAKASSLSGALFTGYYFGITAWLLTEQQKAHAQDDLPPAVVGLVGSAALVAAGLFLERACRVPPPPPSSDPSVHGWADRAEPDAQEAES